MDGVEEVKSRLSIEDVVGEYVQLKRAGRNWRGLSPWTSERTPSFIVSPDKGIWHDFSSGKGGNIFSFVMEMEGLDFKTALELLARKAGVDLDQYRTSGASHGPSKERLYQANELAAHFYQSQFIKNQAVLDYVSKKRQFSRETALAWRLGFSPVSGDKLVKFIEAKKYSRDEIKRAGLVNSYGKDMFRGRLMIPLADAQGRIIGFTARILEAGEPKYINTPSTVLYDKSRHVFGLHHAKEAIRKNNFVVLAEGNLDVIMSHQAGVENVVATAGTALTEPHLKTLARFTSDIRLCFDADKAGLAATERAIPIASKVGVSLGIITIPSGKDPDELIKQDPEAWRKIIDQPDYALDWLIERYQKLLDISNGEGKREFSDKILPVIKKLEDKVEQDHYLNKLAEILEVSRQSLGQKMGTIGDDVTPRRRKINLANRETIDKTAAERAKTEQRLLAILANQPELIKIASLVGPELLNPTSHNIWNLINQADFGLKSSEISGELADHVKILVLQFEELYRGLETSELAYEVNRLQARLIEQYVKTRKVQLSAELAEADAARTKQLLTEARELDNLLNRATKEVS